MQKLILADLTARLLEERGQRHDSWPWTVKYLELADLQFNGQWTATTLDAAKAKAVIVPAHSGEPCRGDRLELVGGGGTSVEAAARWLRTIQDQYATANPTCWRRIQEAAHGPFSTVVLTTEPLGSVEHATLSPRPDSLYHLDGLHRLLGWELASRLRGAISIPAIVAGRRPDDPS